VQRPDIQALLRRVSYDVPEEWSRDDGVARTGFARIGVQTTDGSSRRAEVSEVRGSPGRPLSDAELEAKFAACADLVYPHEAARRLLDGLRRLDRLGSVRELSALMSAEPALAPGD
jgi:2-methylcitrate dehydratase PrpD